jgi:hypothetical protein
VFRRSRLGWSILGAAVSPSHHSPRTSTPPRTQPSRTASHPADTRHMALGGAMVPLNSVVLDRATPAPSAAHSSFGTY